MTVKELIEMLKTCDEESIVYIDYNGDINSINEVCDYSNNCGEVIIVKDIENVKVGTKTTNTTLTCLTGFEVHGQAACVKPENFDLNVGSNYARIKAEDKIWEGLGFVLQWAKYGLKK